jgi:DNA-binding CsgD family transcriptional regulator
MLELAAGGGGAARQALAEGVAMLRRVGDGALLQTALGLLGHAARLEGDAAAARRYWEEAVAVARSLGYRGSLVAALLNLGELALAEGDEPGASARYAEALEAALAAAGEIVPNVLDRLAGLALLQGRPAHALRLFGAAAALRRASGWPLKPQWWRLRDEQIVAARAALPVAEAERAWAAGQGATLDQAVALARGGAAGAGEPPTGGPARAGLPGGLTAREAEVLRHVAAGETDRQIAAALLVTEATVGRHLANVYAKLGVSSRAAATAFALRAGLA